MLMVVAMEIQSNSVMPYHNHIFWLKMIQMTIPVVMSQFYVLS